MAQKEVVLVSKKEISSSYKAPTNGTLTLVCNAPNAEVLLNDKPRGTISSDGKLLLKAIPQGRYKLLIRHADYEPFPKDISISPGRSEAVFAQLRPNFGYVTLSNINLKRNAKLTVEVDSKPLLDSDVQIDGKNVRLRITPTGEHKIRVLQGNSVVVANKLINVDPTVQKVEQVEPVKALLLVKSLPKASVYADDSFCGETSEDGSLVIDKLSPDEPHRVRIEANRYRTYETDITVSTQVDTTLSAKLDAIIEFADRFTDLNKWDAPKEWQVESQLLKVQGTKTFGIPKDLGFRNCEVAFDLRLNKLGRASWIVHAKNERNYYLFSIETSLNKGAELHTYICKDGNLGNSVQTDPIPVPLELGKWHHIRIIVEANKISHFVTPNESPDEVSIGLFQDKDNTFPYGSIGFVTLQGEEFWIGAFVVCPEGANCRPEIKAPDINTIRPQI